jgi:hypothetical protein
MHHTERTQTKSIERYRYCGSADLLEARCLQGPHYARVGCQSCKRHNRYVETPWTLERAMLFEMPFGKHRGRTLGDSARSESGRGYLAWASENLEGTWGRGADRVGGPVVSTVAPPKSRIIDVEAQRAFLRILMDPTLGCAEIRILDGSVDYSNWQYCFSRHVQEHDFRLG